MTKKHTFLWGTILGILILTFSSASAEQANPQSFGFKLGAGIADFAGDDADDMDSKTTLCFGGFFTYSINEQFAIQTELLYVEKGAEWSEEFYDYISGYYITARGDADLTLKYIEIPVLAKFIIPVQTSTVKPNIFCGLALAINTEAEIEMKGSINIDGYSESFSETEDISDEINSFDMGLIFGAGIDIPAGNGAVTLDARYNMGLLNVSEEDDVDLKNSMISFMIGYKF